MSILSFVLFSISLIFFSPYDLKVDAEKSPSAIGVAGQTTKDEPVCTTEVTDESYLSTVRKLRQEKRSQRRREDGSRETSKTRELARTEGKRQRETTSSLGGITVKSFQVWRAYLSSETVSLQSSPKKLRSADEVDSPSREGAEGSGQQTVSRQTAAKQKREDNERNKREAPLLLPRSDALLPTSSPSAVRRMATKKQLRSPVDVLESVNEEAMATAMEADRLGHRRKKKAGQHSPKKAAEEVEDDGTPAVTRSTSKMSSTSLSPVPSFSRVTSRDAASLPVKWSTPEKGRASLVPLFSY